MPIIGRTRTLPQLMSDTRELLAAAWPSRRTTADRPLVRWSPPADAR